MWEGTEFGLVSLNYIVCGMRPPTEGCIFKSGPSQESGEVNHSHTALFPVTAEVYDMITEQTLQLEADLQY